MKGIILLGGYGTRLNLFTRRVTNKALALVYDRLVFEYPLNTLVKAGIDEVALIIGGSRYNSVIVDVIGDGREFGLKKVQYVYQHKPMGISHAIYQAKDFVDDKCAVILGDNFFEMDISEEVAHFKTLPRGCSLFLKKVSDPKRYGVAELDENGSIRDIVEKPSNPKSDMAVTGLYFYDNTVFDKIEKLSPSSRGELEVTDLNMLYVNEGTCCGYGVRGYWNDMGTYDSILDTATFIRKNGYKLDYIINAWN